MNNEMDESMKTTEQQNKRRRGPLSPRIYFGPPVYLFPTRPYFPSKPRYFSATSKEKVFIIIYLIFISLHLSSLLLCVSCHTCLFTHEKKSQERKKERRKEGRKEGKKEFSLVLIFIQRRNTRKEVRNKKRNDSKIQVKE